MTDVELGKLVKAALDEPGFVDAIRERLRTAVEAVIGGAVAELDVRADQVTAGELATSLIAQAPEPGRGRASSDAGSAIRDRAMAPDDVKRRATAFRAMAGVRI